MFRKRPRRARRPRVYRISVETYLVALAIAFALSIALTLLNRPRQIAYGFPHLFSVRDATFLASAHALAERASHGVAVRILLDAVGSGGKVALTDVEALRRAGCVVEFFHPLHPWMLDSI